MPTRRAALSAIGLAFAGFAGCLDGDDGPSGGSTGDGSTAFAALPETRLETEAQFLLVADVNLAALRDAQGPLVEQDGELGDQAASFVEEFPAFDPEGVDRITAQLASGTNVGEESLAAVIEGDVEADAVEAWIDDEVVEEYESGEYEGYTWFAPDDVLFAVGDDRVLVNLPAQRYDSADALVEATVDAAASDGYWFDDEYLTASIDELSGHPNVAAGSIPPEALDQPGEESPIQDLAAGGLGTSPDEDGADVDLVAQFRENADEDALQRLLTQFTGGFGGADPIVGELEYERDGDVVRASASVDDETLSESPLGPVVRFPPFLYFGQISSGGGERPQVPQVVFDFAQQSDGRVEIIHSGGDAIEPPLTISYVVDGQQVEETWRPSDDVVAGDSYVTEQAPDPGTRLRVEWTGDDGETHLLGEHAVA